MMDSGRKKHERLKTVVNLNVTGVQTNVTRKFTPNMSRRQLNETAVPGLQSGSDPKIKTSVSTTYAVNYDTKCDIAYNGYLKALLRKQLVKKKVVELKPILDNQILIQNENLYKRNETYEAMVKDTETFQKRSELVEVIDFLQANLNKLTNVYSKYDMTVQLKNFEEILSSKSDKIVLKNIKCLGSQQEYDKFIDTLQLSLASMQKIISSGRDFEGSHRLAESIRKFLELKSDIEKSQGIVSKLENDAMCSFLQNVSDFFATKHNSELSS